MAVVLLLLPLAQFVVPRTTSQSSLSSQPTYVHEDSKLIYVGNGLIELQLQKTNGGIYSIINKMTGEDYRTVKSVPAETFQLEGPAMGLDSGSPDAFSYSYVSNDTESEVTLKYVFEAAYSATVTATVRVLQNSSLSFWRISIANLGGLVIDKVAFPVINGIGQVGNQTNDNYLLMGDGTGSMVTDLYRSFITNNSAPCCLGSMYPDMSGPLQMMVLGNSYGGLYLATYDTAGNAKEFGATKDNPNWITLHVGHLLPEQLNSTVNISYDTVVGVFKGDWYAAADMYRLWAMKQWWTAQGPLALREDVPPWFKQGFVVYDVTDYDTYPSSLVVSTYSQNVAGLSSYVASINSPVVLELQGWERYGRWDAPNVFPPHEGWASFNQTVKEIHAMGQHVVVALSTSALFLDTPGFNQSMLQCAIKLQNGSLWYDGSNGGVAFASLSCPQAQDWLVNTITALAKAGVDGVITDGTFLNPGDYSSTNGHIPGYGRWWTSALIDTFKRIRSSVEPINPQFILGAEHLPELFIPWVQIYMGDDGLVGFNGLVEEFGSNLRQTGLFAYVYGGYAIGYDREVNTGPLQSGAAETYREFTQAFGLTVGSTVNLAYSYQPVTAPDSSLSRSLAWASSSFAKDFTMFGTRVAAPFIDVPAVTIEISSDLFPSVRDYATPAVLSGAWISGDGRLGYLFANIDNASHSFTLNVDASYLSSGEAYSVLSVNEMGATTSAFDTSNPTLAVTVQPKEALTVEIVPASLVQRVLLEYVAFSGAYLAGMTVFRASQIGLDVHDAYGAILSAEGEYSAQDYSQSIALSLQALSQTARSFSRFGELLADRNAYSAYLVSFDSEASAGMYTQAFSSAEAAIGIGMGSLRQVFSSVLFDQKHTDLVHLNYTPMTSGFNPDWDQFASYVDSTLGMNITAQTDISGQSLGKSEVAVLAVPDRPFSNQDVQSYLQFVSSGGGLLIIGLGGMPTYLNSLTDHFGIHLTGGKVTATNHLWDAGSFEVTDIDQSDPVTGDVRLLISNWMAPVSVASNVVVPAWTDSASNSSSGAKGPFPFVAEATYGSGRVVFVASMLFDDCCLGGPGAMQLLSNAMAWLSQPSGIGNTVLVTSVSADSRVGVGSTQSVGFRLAWAANGSSASGAAVAVNGSSVITGSDGWAWLRTTQSEVGLSSYVVQSANSSGRGVRVILSTDAFPEVIWDRVDVYHSTVVSQLTTGTNATISWSGYYEYDHAPFSGLVILNDTTLKQAPGTYAYTVKGIADNRYNLTAFSSNTVSVEFVQPSTSTLTSTSGTSSSPSGGGIPEFPFQLVALAAFTSAAVVSYLLLRRRKSV